MDFATIVGILAGFALIAVALVRGGTGSGREFLHAPSMLIVLGGTVSATLVHFSLAQFLRIILLVKKTVFYRLPTEHDVVQRMVNYAAINRRDGALVLEQQVPSAGDAFLAKGLRMVVDGQKPEEMDQQLSTEIEHLRQRHTESKRILEFMGSAAPAFGMIGTLIGLVQMLSKLEDPSKIGAGMATALITTFYGALLANLVFIPLAGKLGMRSKREGLLREMMLEGLLGIIRGEGPTVVRERMHAFISARKREDLRPRI